MCIEGISDLYPSLGPRYFLNAVVRCFIRSTGNSDTNVKLFKFGMSHLLYICRANRD